MPWSPAYLRARAVRAISPLVDEVNPRTGHAWGLLGARLVSPRVRVRRGGVFVEAPPTDDLGALTLDAYRALARRLARAGIAWHGLPGGTWTLTESPLARALEAVGGDPLTIRTWWLGLSVVNRRWWLVIRAKSGELTTAAHWEGLVYLTAHAGDAPFGVPGAL